MLFKGILGTPVFAKMDKFPEKYKVGHHIIKLSFGGHGHDQEVSRSIYICFLSSFFKVAVTQQPVEVKNRIKHRDASYLLSGGFGGPMRTLGLGILGTFLIWANRSAGIPGPVCRKRAFQKLYLLLIFSYVTETGKIVKRYKPVQYPPAFVPSFFEISRKMPMLSLAQK